jgi:2-dehydropantoate 2-reductase
MRYVIYGAGAIGGLVGARLHQSGHRVQLIARGPHHDAIERDGLTLLSPTERETFRIPVARGAAGAGLQADDVILLCVKTQDTLGALLDIRDAAPRLQLPIVCMQNGVASEEMALRLFPEVHGAVVLVPAEHLEPGVVAGYGSRSSGRIDVGRYPAGADARSHQICEALAGSRFDSDARPDIMVHKYAKLIQNLANGVEAICGPGQLDGPNRELIEGLRAEGREVLRTAQIEFEVQHVADVVSRWAQIGFAPIDGREHQGGSGWQSVVRGAGSIETDYLNGEIVFLGRRFGVPAPLNEAVQALARETVIERREPGWLTPAQILELVAASPNPEAFERPSVDARSRS